MKTGFKIATYAGLALLGTLTALARPPVPSPEEYARQCEQELGPIPVFNCMWGESVPVYDSDTKQEITDQNHQGYGTRCDHPSLLRTDGVNRFGHYNPCVPYTRVGRSPPGQGFETQWVWSCRRYFVRPKDDVHFDDINMIGHNPKTGATCFFVSKINRKPPVSALRSAVTGAVGMTPKRVEHGLDGTKVPSMFSPEAAAFWKSPKAMDSIPAWRGGSQRCVECHDANPFMHTPFFQQVTTGTGDATEPLLPGDPDGRYYVVGFTGPEWKLKHLVSPEAQACTRCHRIGDRRTCGDLSAMAVGTRGHNRLTKTFFKRPWMPQHDDFWSFEDAHADEKFVKAVQFINRCCKSPKLPECKWEPVPGRK